MGTPARNPLDELRERRKTPHACEEYGFATKCIHAGQAPDLVTGAVNIPITLSSTYAQESPGILYDKYEYSRTQNPTRFAFEDCVAALENCKFGKAYASGCGATTQILSMMKPGEHMIAGDDLYGGTSRLFKQVSMPCQNVQFSFVDTTDLSNIERAFTPNTKFLWLETPSNPMLKVTDIAAAAELCKRRDVKLVVDNTFASPALQKPADLGADIVYHSVTKYLSGHSDVIMGALTMNDEEMHEKLKFL
jgi:cystathionine beta-lyase/cystathionine gamma-synthase